MKLIKEIDERYYPSDEEAEQIKHNGKITLSQLAYELNISYQHLWRKLKRHKYPNNAFSRMEVEKIQKLLKIKFDVH